MNTTASNKLLALLLLLLIAIAAVAASGMDASGGGKGVDESGECDAEDGADGSCDASALAVGDDDEASPPEKVGIEGETAAAAVQEAECVDKEPRCAYWAAEGECEENPDYMLVECQLSCNSCPEPLVLSPEEARLMEAVAKYGVAQRVEGKKAPETLDVIRRTVNYMENDIYTNSTYDLSEEILAECTNREDLCAFWAVIGECEKNPTYMKTKCAPSCRTCELIDINIRCPPIGDDVRPGLFPGELNAMFERIVSTAPGNQSDPNLVVEEGMTNYTVTVHSRPKAFGVGEERVISRIRDMEQPPWVITFENFVTEEECTEMINLGHRSKYKRSEDVGDMLPDGTYDSKKSDTRTSENAWCSDSESNKCRTDKVAKLIHDRIAKVTGIPPENSEDFQILKYEPGQFYRQHHDYIEFQRDRRCGPRILTFFLYLSDVEEGGATNFPDLNIAVKPKVGRALLWPSVLDSNPRDKEPRTDHEAQDVIKGIKFGANSWMHLYDYIDAQKMGCT
ncbi:hypothetical protein ACHAW5_006422 [Stephanodiscus triporus]|uniref:Procollagen-proline 4-dioxygenase n=1 Tax=Stephanodiscus triporus TaxID=2934178 RepID=A0ABD3NYU4_9STRA